MRKTLEDLTATDAQGRSEVSLRLPAIPRTARPLEADVLLRLREPGGRAIERKVSMAVAPAEARVGVKPLFAGNEVGEGETASIRCRRWSRPTARRSRAASFKWELLRLDQRWQWYSRDGQWNYETVTTTRRIGGGTVNASVRDSRPRIAAQVDWGRYRLEVSAVGSTAATSSVTFNSGWHASDNLDSPEMLDIALDKPSYKAGETARVKIASKQAGKVTIAVLSNKLLATQQADIPAGGGEIALPVQRRVAAGRLRDGDALSPPGRESAAHAGPRHRREVARRRYDRRACSR